MTFDTLKKVFARCDEDGDCMIWRGYTGKNGHPKTGNGSVRRLAWRLSGKNLPKNKLLTVTCGQSLCLNPKHMALTTKAEVVLKTLTRIDVSIRRQTFSKNAVRKSMGKITMEIAREIRCSDKRGVELARELGVSQSLVSLVKRGKTWKEPASVWSGLVR